MRFNINSAVTVAIQFRLINLFVWLNLIWVNYEELLKNISVGLFINFVRRIMFKTLNSRLMLL